MKLLSKYYSPDNSEQSPEDSNCSVLSHVAEVIDLGGFRVKFWVHHFDSSEENKQLMKSGNLKKCVSKWIQTQRFKAYKVCIIHVY